MIAEDPDKKDYIIVAGEPFLTKDFMGKYIVLQEETLFGGDDEGRVDKYYSSEIVVDDDPSEKTIFEYKLKGAVKQSTWSVGRQQADN